MTFSIPWGEAVLLWIAGFSGSAAAVHWWVQELGMARAYLVVVGVMLTFYLVCKYSRKAKEKRGHGKKDRAFKLVDAFGKDLFQEAV